MTSEQPYDGFPSGHRRHPFIIFHVTITVDDVAFVPTLAEASRWATYAACAREDMPWKKAS